MRVLLVGALAAALAAATDFYEVLEIARTADASAVKKAYKQKMIRYHPDRFEGEEKARMTAKFNAVQEAFEVLSSAQMRALYDQQGAVGLEEFRREQQQREGFKSQRQAQEEMWARQQKAPDALAGAEFELLDLSGLPRFYRRGQAYVLLFYREATAEISALRAPLDRMAADYRGVFTVARVNCEEEEELCREFLVYSPPRLFVFPSYAGMEGIEVDLQAALPQLRADDAKPFLSRLFAQINSVTEDFVAFLSPATLAAFEAAPRPKFVLFTAKGDTPLTWRVLSKEFRGAAQFGVVRPSSQLSEQLGVSAFPAVHFYLQRLERPHVFEGKITTAGLKTFIRDMIAAAAAQPLAVLQTVSFDEVAAGRSCGATEKKLCVLLVAEPGAEKQWDAAIEHLQDRFRKDALKVAVVPRGALNPSLVVGGLAAREAHLVVYKGSRRQARFFAAAPSDLATLNSAVSDCISELLALHPLPADLFAREEEL